MLALPHGGPFKLTYEGELHLGRWYDAPTSSKEAQGTLIMFGMHSYLHMYYVCTLGTDCKGRS